jgi:hypothetical protein
LCVLEAKNFHGIYRGGVPFGLANVDKWRHNSLSDYEIVLNILQLIDFSKTKKRTMYLKPHS